FPGFRCFSFTNPRFVLKGNLFPTLSVPDGTPAYSLGRNPLTRFVEDGCQAHAFVLIRLRVLFGWAERMVAVLQQRKCSPIDAGKQ
ncbi:hypothetical protein MUK42_33139, partial [Musa troglodytarum]